MFQVAQSKFQVKADKIVQSVDLKIISAIKEIKSKLNTWMDVTTTQSSLTLNGKYFL